MNHTPPVQDDICAIFVTYNPDSAFPERVRALLPQVAFCVVVDNNSLSRSYLSSEKKIKDERDIEIIKNSKNLGLAAALNQGVRFATKHRYRWVLMMDQDSFPTPSMVPELINGYLNAQNDGIIADLIGVNFTYEDTGERAFSRECNRREYIQKHNIGIQTSGSLLSLHAYESVGPFYEYFFIDYIDTEYCIRLQQKKFNTIIACRANMLHNISERYVGIRRYYRWRNWLIIAMKHPLWAIKNFYEKKEVRRDSAL